MEGCLLLSTSCDCSHSTAFPNGFSESILHTSIDGNVNGDTTEGGLFTAYLDLVMCVAIVHASSVVTISFMDLQSVNEFPVFSLFIIANPCSSMGVLLI